MQLKTNPDDSEIMMYCHAVANKFTEQNLANLIANIKQKLNNHHILNLVLNAENQLIGALLAKIEEDFFGVKQFIIIDIEIFNHDSQNEIIDLIYSNILKTTNNYKCRRIIYFCLTKNKFLQKFFSSQKFILEQFVFKNEIDS